MKAPLSDQQEAKPKNWPKPSHRPATTTSSTSPVPSSPPTTPLSSAIPSSPSATSATASPPKPTATILSKKKRLPRSQRNLSPLPLRRRLSRRRCHRLVGLCGELRLPTRLLLLPTLRPRAFSPSISKPASAQRRLTPAAERLATLAGGVSDSFDKARQLLHEMAGVRLSESTVERTTEDVGQRIARLLGKASPLARMCVGVGIGMPRDEAWPTSPWMPAAPRQQGPGGRHADGRMAYVGGVYNPPPPEWLRPGGPAPPLQARYVSGLYSLAQMGPLLRYQATAVGMQPAEVWIALSDGGNGLEELLQSHFNRADLVVILDFYHAASYVQALARALYADEREQASRQAEQWCRLLKEEGGATTLAVLRAWDWPARKSWAWRAAWQALESYFANNLHRMEYPEYVAEGWQIGSGVVESACKTVVGQRLKGAGKRWGEAGAHALCHVRAFTAVRMVNGRRSGSATTRTDHLFHQQK